MAGTLSYAQLEGLWLKAAAGTSYGTRTWAALMAAIAEAESGGNPAAVNPDDDGGRQSSYGLWQVSTGTHAPPSPSWADPATNAGLALGKLQSQGLGAWGTYTSGAYRTYISGSTTPDLAVAGSPAAVTAETAASAGSDCLYGFQGISGTSWINDIVGNGGNVGQFCLLTRSEARGVAGVGLVAAGAGVMIVGVALALITAGMESPVVRKAALRGAAGAAPGGGAPSPAPPPAGG